jgi:hypothetical protein
MQAVLSAIAMPWGAFIAAFLYYAVLTLLAVSGASLPAALVAVSYLLPVALYAGALLTRAVRALDAITIDIGETPHALLP